jgi:Flp pilus assembly protein TadG
LKHMCLQKEISMRVHACLPRRLASDARGTELLEFALVLPVLVMLLLGAVWMGQVVSVYQALGRAAREGARVYLAPASATLGNGQTDPTTTIDNALTAASLDYTQASVVFNNNQALNPGDPANYQVAGVTVSVTYPVKLNIPFTPWNGTRINLISTVTMRQEF